jgi:hypothetical protein
MELVAAGCEANSNLVHKNSTFHEGKSNVNAVFKGDPF